MNNKLLFLAIFCTPIYAMNKPIQDREEYSRQKKQALDRRFKKREHVRRTTAELFEACTSNKLEDVMTLLGINRDMKDAYNENGQTLLHVAPTPEMMRVLITRGISRQTVADDNGSTALMTQLSEAPAIDEKLVSKIHILLDHATESGTVLPMDNAITRHLKRFREFITADDKELVISIARDMMKKPVHRSYFMWMEMKLVVVNKIVDNEEYRSRNPMALYYDNASLLSDERHEDHVEAPKDHVCRMIDFRKLPDFQEHDEQ